MELYANLVESFCRRIHSTTNFAILIFTVVCTFAFLNSHGNSFLPQNLPNRKTSRFINNAENGFEKQREVTEIDPELAKIIHGGNSLPNYFLTPGIEDSVFKNTTLSFVHYPKGGGTTIKDCVSKINQKYGKAEPFTVFAKNAGETKEKMLNGGFDDVDFFMGTYGFSLCEHLKPRRCAHFTVLRDPYDRMVSHYFFCKYGGGSNAPCNQPIEEFALLVRSIFFHQLTCLHKCQKGTAPEGGWMCDREQLEVEQIVNYNFTEIEMVLNYAEQQMEEMFAVVGILEELDTTLLLLQEALGIPFHDECQNSHSNARPKESEERKEERIQAKKLLMENKDVQRALEADVRLYQRAKKIFEKQKERSLNFKSLYKK
ncbi:hypothetical protein BSL78_13812 [Apostichopus japonicus]|uniref:Sulfotransferase n=1 Tax=Stichopus japonicus TaxID=307972 RepID=A0A2G8KMV1_STIJA|nr:hypothetical protein BSL78_13812 [Apostichopus japonicus]